MMADRWATLLSPAIANAKRRVVSIQSGELSFVIPTYRLREVGKTIEEYDQHFWQHGHSVRLMVFDDSAPDTQEKYYRCLENTQTYQSVYYVGPREKDQFLNYLLQQLRDQKLEALVRNMFRSQLRRQSQCHLDVHAGRAYGQLR